MSCFAKWWFPMLVIGILLLIVSSIFIEINKVSSTPLWAWIVGGIALLMVIIAVLIYYMIGEKKYEGGCYAPVREDKIIEETRVKIVSPQGETKSERVTVREVRPKTEAKIERLMTREKEPRGERIVVREIQQQNKKQVRTIEELEECETRPKFRSNIRRDCADQNTQQRGMRQQRQRSPSQVIEVQYEDPFEDQMSSSRLKIAEE